jgi:hypothetical protein
MWCNNNNKNRCQSSCCNKGYRRRWIVEVMRALWLIGLGGQGHNLPAILPDKTVVSTVGEAVWAPWHGEEKNVLPLTVFIPKMFPLAESIGSIKHEFGKCAWKKAACVRVQQHQREKNAQTAKYVNRPLTELSINLGNSETQNRNTKP